MVVRLCLDQSRKRLDRLIILRDRLHSTDCLLGCGDELVLGLLYLVALVLDFFG